MTSTIKAPRRTPDHNLLHLSDMINDYWFYLLLSFPCTCSYPWNVHADEQQAVLRCSGHHRNDRQHRGHQQYVWSNYTVSFIHFLKMMKINPLFFLHIYILCLFFAIILHFIIVNVILLEMFLHWYVCVYTRYSLCAKTECWTFIIGVIQPRHCRLWIKMLGFGQVW